MLEGLAAWILNTYIGEYLENLNTDQLSIGLIQGEVELDNIPLKKDALKNLGLPFEIEAGFIGKVKLQIPVRRLRSEPWIISVEGLYLIAGPLVWTQYDEEAELKANQNRKISRLDALEAKWKIGHESKEATYTFSSYSSWFTNGTSLVANIVENIQLNIKDVHLRYEDDQTNPCCPFAVGITIHSLSAQSTDENWVAKFVNRDNTNMMYKLLQLNGLALYWDNMPEMLGRLDIGDIAEKMKICIEPSDYNIQNHDYILSPVSAEAHLKRNCTPKPLRSRSTPRLVCDLQLQKIPLALNELQYRQIVEWEREFERIDTLWKYRKWRPLVPVKNNAKEWWQYAIQVHLQPLRQYHNSHTWSFVLQRASDITQYVKIYHISLTAPEEMNELLKAQKDLLESELSFDELCILREMVMEKITKDHIAKADIAAQSKGQGLLQRWFPGWAGWYSSEQYPSQEQLSDNEPLQTQYSTSKDPEVEELKVKLEEEILDALGSAEDDSVLKRDTVFAQLNFSLSQGTCTLIAVPHNNKSEDDNFQKVFEMKPLMELEFSDVKTTIETRPRSGSLLFAIKLGAIYLHDRLSPNSTFPHIVAPQNKESPSLSKFAGVGLSEWHSNFHYLSPNSEISSPLFELLYERKPFNSVADHKLVVNLHSLDVVYNPHSIRSALDFFCLHEKSDSSELKQGGLKLTAAARTRYEVLKQQTKAELKQKWDEILEGEHVSARWEIQMALSAPQIIVPENTYDSESSVVVFDLGKLQFFNTASKENVANIDEDEEEDFMTPCSTPPVENLDTQMEKESSLYKMEELSDIHLKQSSETEISFREHLYERYTLELSDMQVLVSQAKDNWKLVQLHGTSRMHVLDRFSISLQMERRLVHTSDPLLPSVTLSGKLPKLVVHASEQKIQALQSCVAIFSTPIIGPFSSTSRHSSLGDVQKNTVETVSRNMLMPGNLSNWESDSKISGSIQRDITEESLLLLMQFCVDQMYFEVQSRGRCVAELQVTGVKAVFSKRICDISLTLCVHSLLLVDALQTFGPDFELLVASHKNVSMDSVSGNLRDSEANSPASSKSPDPPSPATSALGLTTPSSVTTTLCSMQSSKGKHKSSPLSLHPAHPPLPREPSDSDALIMLEFVIINSPSPEKQLNESLEKLHIATVQFNNLDVIANQETIVELVGFMKRISLAVQSSQNISPEELTVTYDKYGNSEATKEMVIDYNTRVVRTEVTFDFHHLNILLLRAVSKNRSTVGQKVATAALSGAKIQASFGESIQIQGTLGGLQVLDLITDLTKHQRIISVGYDPLSICHNDLVANLQTGVYKQLSCSDTSEPQKALTFVIVRTDNDKKLAQKSSFHDIKEVLPSEKTGATIDITVRMASLCYTHSPRLLYELSSCATEFKEYMSILASSIKSAAAEVAIGIVTKRTEAFAASLYWRTTDYSSTRNFENSFSQMTDGKQTFSNIPVFLQKQEVEVAFKIDVLLQTPVVVIPCSPSSSDVLVAHLGRFTIKNSPCNKFILSQCSLNNSDYSSSIVLMEVRDMNLYTLDIDNNVKIMTSEESTTALFPYTSVQETYDCTKYGQPVLHDTVIEVTLQHLMEPCNFMTSDSLDNKWMTSNSLKDRCQPVENAKLIKVTGQVVTPLKVALSKSQYKQVLMTLDNLTHSCAETVEDMLQESHEKCFAEKDIEDLELQPSMSALKLDTDLPEAQKSGSSYSVAASEESKAEYLKIHASFGLPDFTVELQGNLDDEEQGLVSLSFQEFVLNFKKEDQYETSLQITLNALVMEDLQEAPTSKHRYLMVSSGRNQHKNSQASISSYPLKSQFLSTSCPDVTGCLPYVHSISSSSLPDHLHTQNFFCLHRNKGNVFNSRIASRNASRWKPSESYPSTPPPSPSEPSTSTSHWMSQDVLVRINILLVDKHSPKYNTSHNCTNRLVDIDFSCLDTTINLQTWVMVLDFFDIGAEPENFYKEPALKNSAVSKENDSTEDSMNKEEPEVINTEVELTACSLTLTLNKPEYELAIANISNFCSRLSLRDRNFSIQGKLGSISVIDLTPYGHCYPEKFVTSGSEVLHFDIFRHGRPDPHLSRDYDIQIRCQMSSVRYVHTYRFQREILSFFQHFNQMQNLVARLRAAAAGAMVSTVASRSLRILLDISAGSPVIVIPQSYSSSEVLVANLGQLTIYNSFLFAGSPGTVSTLHKVPSSDISTSDSEGDIPVALTQSLFGSLEKDARTFEMESTNVMLFLAKKQMHPMLYDRTGVGHSCLLDVIHVELADMDLYSAVRLSRLQASASATCSRDKYRQLGNSDLCFPSFCIAKQGSQLLKEKFALKVQVERNLDTTVSRAVPDMTMEGSFSSVHFTLDLKQYKLIRGILDCNLGEPLEEFYLVEDKEEQPSVQMDCNDQTWTCLAIHMDLMNVTLELVQTFDMEKCLKTVHLAKFDFIKSRLSYESYSDESKDIDLVSHEIRLSDTRYSDSPVNNRPNVFVNILHPTKQGSQQSVLQAEIHHRVTKDLTRFTVLLNTMRVIVIFDWLKSVLEFISTNPDVSVINNKTASNINLQRTKVISAEGTGSAIPKKEVPFEMKLNVTDAEFVVVEDSSSWDTNAVILKSTSVITWKPSSSEKPLSCSFQSLEVFSCILGIEDDTALSIIDPVTVNADIVEKTILPNSSDIVHALEVSMQNLNLRLSYYDVTMFFQIFESIQKQTGIKFRSTPSLTTDALVSSDSTGNALQSLKCLGFSEEDCTIALESCKGRVNDAALWLTRNATPCLDLLMQDEMEKTENIHSRNLNLQAIEIRIYCGSLCIIDDCKDADVPLLELTLTDMAIHQTFSKNQEGTSTFMLGGDYYNRALSGWEPFLEPWPCSVKWRFFKGDNTKKQKILCRIEAEDVLNLNITGALLELYQSVKKNWTEDYFKLNSKDSQEDDPEVGTPSGYKRRTPFVPYALRNETGCKLWFATVTTSSARRNSWGNQRTTSVVANKDALTWTEVGPEQIVPFTFGGRDKIRHKDTHELKVHQLIVRVDGWQEVSPVSVNKVGVYFRQAKPQSNRSSSVYTETLPARIVFAVTLEGSVQKMITVRSAVLLTNKLSDTIELKIENSVHSGGGFQRLYLIPQITLPLPLPFVHAQIMARPSDKNVTFSNQPIVWHHITKVGDVGSAFRICHPSGNNYESYRFCVCVKRENYPIDGPSHSNLLPSTSRSTTPPKQISLQPGHRIMFLPPLELTNLLPYELHYIFNKINIKGFIKPGKAVPLHVVDITSTVSIQFSLSNFPRSNQLIINPTSRRFETQLEIYDTQNRILLLQVTVLPVAGSALKIYISVPYWLVNKTGLPLVFRQDGTQLEAAGQFEEHELARSVAPLLFSFADREAYAMCNMRVGKSLHPNGIPIWCSHFHLEKGIRVQQLHVSPRDSKPDWVYIIGIDVREGRGRYRNTNIVTLSPRYQLDNRSSHKVEFAQKFATQNNSFRNKQYVSSALPQCTLPFHWPRLDLDNLLCVRFADVPGCCWSGGFTIDTINSFQVNMRDDQGGFHFLRVEIISQGATFIVFSDTEKMPPPLRIDNHSEVPITFYQTKVVEERLKTVVKAHSSTPYAWDEIKLPPFITCCAPGGYSATYNMDVFGQGDQLFYENFIYIAFTATFLRSKKTDHLIPLPSDDLSSQQLVLDVPYGTAVVINKKEPGKRSQLWRMTMSGVLYHEGSSPPRDPRKHSSSDVDRSLVLDIAGLGPIPTEYTPLMLRKYDDRRKFTQTWKFTSDGRLCCGHPNMYVQAKDGFAGLNSGNDVVLGRSQPVSYITMDNGIPVEQAISRHKLRKGSGVLNIKVIPDGPTRVLQITDINQKQILSKTSDSSEWVVIEEQNKCTSLQSTSANSQEKLEPNDNSSVELQLCINLHGGLGISLINHLCEELVYAMLHNIVVDYSKSSNGHSLNGSVQNIQIDNQLRGAESQVVLYITPPGKNDHQRHLPAIYINFHKVAVQNINADIFKHLIITVRNLTLQVEEQLLLKLLQFAGYNQSDVELEKIDESDNHVHRSVSASASSHWFYFNILKLSLHQVRLSVLTTSQLPADLSQIKQKMGIKLLRFEDAIIELDPFVRVHPFETMNFLLDSIVEHYKEELKGQAAKILGAVDFLGSPFGFMYDVSDGISELLNEGNVGGLIKNVAHGLSNSAAKVTGSLSDGIGKVAMDDRHEEIRRRIRQDNVNTSSDHLKAGFKGLGFGLFSGVTSLFTQAYEGAASEGMQGFISGLGKGLVGTVAKPAVGFLDFASGAASAVRDTSKKNNSVYRSRKRPPRLCVGPGGLLPRYSQSQALGQEFLYNLNGRNYKELFIAREQLGTGNEDLQALISNEHVYILSCSSALVNNVILTVHLSEISHCSLVTVNDHRDEIEPGRLRYYLTIKGEYHTKSPQVKCDSEEIAQKVCQEINYAKSLYEEQNYTVIPDNDDLDMKI